MPQAPVSQVHDITMPPALSTGDLALFELQRPFVEPLLRMLRFTNTGFDTLFYDVGVLTAALSARGTRIQTHLSAKPRSAPHPLESLDLTALTNPSGSVIVVDATATPTVKSPFRETARFFEYANGPDGACLHTIAITGVGSSAFGSV